MNHRYLFLILIVLIMTMTMMIRIIIMMMMMMIIEIIKNFQIERNWVFLCVCFWRKDETQTWKFVFYKPHWAGKMVDYFTHFLSYVISLKAEVDWSILQWLCLQILGLQAPCVIRPFNFCLKSKIENWCQIFDFFLILL